MAEDKSESETSDRDLASSSTTGRDLLYLLNSTASEEIRSHDSSFDVPPYGWPVPLVQPGPAPSKEAAAVDISGENVAGGWMATRSQLRRLQASGKCRFLPPFLYDHGDDSGGADLSELIDGDDVAAWRFWSGDQLWMMVERGGCGLPPSSPEEKKEAVAKMKTKTRDR